MATSVLRNLSISVQKFLNRCNVGLFELLRSNGLILEPAVAVPALRGKGLQSNTEDSENGSPLSGLFDGFLWAVPKHRRGIERNRGRRRAADKMIKYNESLIPCETCGNLRQFGYICGHCLVRIREETKQIQEEMFGELDKEGVIPDKENVILYEGETLSEADRNHKHPVEIKKKRPAWFSKDLVRDWRKW